jgi:glycyl-tRNA synthetase beta chain
LAIPSFRQRFWAIQVRSRDSRPPLYGRAEFTIDHTDQYPQILLERGKVIADYEVRKAAIKAGAEKAARNIGSNADLSESLLEEVTSLVEWPVVLTAKFEEKFLAVPSEALVYHEGDQKYFPVYANGSKLLPNFIFVANIESKRSDSDNLW